MRNMFGERGKLRPGLTRFQGADDGAGLPTLQSGDNKLEGRGLRKDNRLRIARVSEGIQFFKCPSTPRNEIAQGRFACVFLDDLAPALVKHLRVWYRNSTFCCKLLCQRNPGSWYWLSRFFARDVPVPSGNSRFRDRLCSPTTRSPMPMNLFGNMSSMM